MHTVKKVQTNKTLMSHGVNYLVSRFLIMLEALGRYVTTESNMASDNSSTTALQSELQTIKEQLNLVSIIPVVTELKQAYDFFNQPEEGGVGSDDIPIPTGADPTTSMAPVSNNDPRQAVAPSPGPSTENADLQTSGRSLVAQTPTNESNFGTSGTGELSRADPTSLPSASISTLKSLTGMQVGNKIVINETVAESVSHVLTHGMEAETIQTLDRTIKMPLNYDRLGVIVCNPEVFKQAPMDIKRLDKELQGVQKVLMQSLSALTQVLSGTTGQADPDMAELVANAVGLSSHASHQLDLARRKLFQPSIREDFRGLCTEEYPVEDFLFSKNIGEKLKTMGDTARITKSIGKAAASPSARLGRGPDMTGRAKQQPPHYDQRGDWEPQHLTYRDRVRHQGPATRGKGTANKRFPGWGQKDRRM